MHIAKSQINDQIVIAIDNECTKKYLKKDITSTASFYFACFFLQVIL